MEHLSIGMIRHFVEIHANIAYLIIFLGVISEGEIVVIFAGIVSYLGSLNIFVAFLSVVAGGLGKTFLGYTIGYYLQEHHSHRPFISKMERRISHFLPHFEDRPFWSIFTARFFILGIGWFTIILSGYKKVAKSIYVKAEVFSLIIWSILYLALGHFFSFTALSVSRDVRKFLGIIVLFLIAFFIIEKILTFVVELFNKEENMSLEK